MITPAHLKKGDTIGIVSPGAQIAKDKIENAIKILKEFGFKVRLGKNVLNKSEYFAGTDKERTTDFQNMLDDDNIKAILCSRGGYGTLRVIENLNFTDFLKNPKWIVGFSDVTVLHAHINNYLGIESLHATMPIDFPKNGINSGINSMISALKGINPIYEFEVNKLNKNGVSQGILTGGNLSVLYSLRGTKFDINPEGKILFLEDIGENLYHIDRMLMNLRIGGIFDKISGLIIGGFNEMRDSTNSFARSAYEVISNVMVDYRFPVIYDFPAGHTKENLAICFGKLLKMEVARKIVTANYL